MKTEESQEECKDILGSMSLLRLAALVLDTKKTVIPFTEWK
jgi:hypothetical protein